jgi:hypothetical protein
MIFEQSKEFAKGETQLRSIAMDFLSHGAFAASLARPVDFAMHSI